MTEDETGHELLRPLLNEPAPPSGLDVAGVVRKGRNRVRTRRLLGTGGAAAAVLVVVPLAFNLVQAVQQAPRTEASPGVAQPTQSTQSAPAPPVAPVNCVAAALPVPAWAVDSYVLAGDPTGRYLVGYAAAPDGFWKALLWDRGALTVLDTPTADIEYLAVNSSGVIAGSGREGVQIDSANIAWVYRDGQYSILPQPKEHQYEFVSAVAVNEHGDVLGSDNGIDFNQNTGQYYPQQLPLVWPAEAPGTWRQLPAPAGDGMVRANGIDDDGTVVGARISMPGETGERFSHALVWSPDGSGRELDGDSLAAVRTGWALGHQEAGPFRLNLRTGEAKQLRLAFAGAVNAHGWMAGQTRRDRISTPAVEFGRGKVITLPLPDGAVAGTDGVGATFVSDDGRAVGGSVATGPDDRMAVSWACR